VDPKDEAQLKLAVAHDIPCPGDVYRHYKGGLYAVVAVALAEDTLAPLVVYRSNAKGTTWARTLHNFREMVGDHHRFTRVLD
jgi:hypothetical protein